MTERYDTRLWGGFALTMRYAQTEERTRLSPEAFDGTWDEDLGIWDEFDAMATYVSMGLSVEEAAKALNGKTSRTLEERVRHWVIELGEWL